MSQNLQKRNSQTSVAPQQKPSDGKSFPELMKALDNAKVDMPAEDLLRILKFCEGDRNLMNDFNVFRRRKWFVMIGRLRPTEINTAQLIKMMEYLIRLDLRPERYHAKFYPGWEVLSMIFGKDENLFRFFQILSFVPHLSPESESELKNSLFQYDHRTVHKNMNIESNNSEKRPKIGSKNVGTVFTFKFSHPNLLLQY